MINKISFHFRSKLQCKMNRWLDFFKAFSAVLFNDRLLVAVLCSSLRPVSLSEWDNNFQETCDELWGRDSVSMILAQTNPVCAFGKAQDSTTTYFL